VRGRPAAAHGPLAIPKRRQSDRRSGTAHTASRLRHLAYCGGILTLWLAPAASLTAQITITPTVFVAYVQHQVDIGYGDEQTGGAVLGALVTVSPTRWTDVTVSGYGGTLNSDSGSIDTRRMSDLELSGSVSATPSLALQIGLRAQSYSTPLARQRWLSVSVGGEFAPEIFDGAARAVLVPVANVSGLPNPTLGVLGGAGFEFLRGPLTGGVYFSLERFDFPTINGAARAEQLVLLTAQIGVRFPR
jgi:hypothetical protein